MFLHLSVVLSMGGGVCPSACWDRHPLPGTHPPPPPQTATAADGTHPTGMYSCSGNKTDSKRASSDVRLLNRLNWTTCNKDLATFQCNQPILKSYLSDHMPIIRILLLIFVGVSVFGLSVWVNKWLSCVTLTEWFDLECDEGLYCTVVCCVAGHHMTIQKAWICATVSIYNTITSHEWNTLSVEDSVFSPKKSTGCPVVSRLKKYLRTRKHSSRMCTARLLTVSQHALPGGVLARECTCWGVYLPGSVSVQGVYLPGGVPAQGGAPARGCTCPGGGRTCLWGCTCPGTPCEQNDRQVQKYCLPPYFVWGR